MKAKTLLSEVQTHVSSLDHEADCAAGAALGPEWPVILRIDGKEVTLKSINFRGGKRPAIILKG